MCRQISMLIVTCPTVVKRKLCSAKFLFFVSCIFCLTFLYWIQLNFDCDISPTDENLVQEALNDGALDPRYYVLYQKPDKLPKDLKYILLWTSDDIAPFYFYGKGQRSFIENNCSVINCYVTSNRKFFGGNLTKFDAIFFNGRSIYDRKPDLPNDRSFHQKYVFSNMESSDNYPVCQDQFDGFFNWTSTYRLDSDIPAPYIQIRNIDGEVVGPKKNMYWRQDVSNVAENLAIGLINKTKAAAWFVSHCDSRSQREVFVKDLKTALSYYGLDVDIYGQCGTLKCPRGKAYCDVMLESEYYFYLSLENSFDEDYVTEKLLNAVKYNVVPIVFGGANYSRFLPPKSYLDARKHSPVDLASIMARLMFSPKLYREYFRWKSSYTYHDPSQTDNVCAICEALNNRTRMETVTTYKSFRRWWQPNYKRRCKKWYKVLK